MGLDPTQIEAVLKKAKAKDIRTQPKGVLWPSIADIKLILAAAESKAKTVTLSCERKYAIKYNRVVLGEEAIYISPIDTSKGFCPCGDFRLRKLREYVTIAEAA